MNKQEMIKTLEELKYHAKHSIEIDKYESYWQGKTEAYVNAIGLVQQLDEQQKPVVPKCAEPFLKKSKYSTDVIDLFSEVEYATDSDGFIWENWEWTADFYDWVVEDSDTFYILCDALRYGYEVEKEPIYYVKHKDVDTYFVEFINSNFGSTWDEEIQRAKSFKDKTKAEAVEVLVDGEVVEG
ncbi:DUF1642 domain-containing protein [Enterococcus thailandicus]|uniref:DUF1642 domain-containing protein n=1 Tax=Enterococcus thailandicus TaxID=417368 RepID=UPI0037514935